MLGLPGGHVIIKVSVGHDKATQNKEKGHEVSGYKKDHAWWCGTKMQMNNPKLSKNTN
jgi:hypothetical protein